MYNELIKGNKYKVADNQEAYVQAIDNGYLPV